MSSPSRPGGLPESNDDLIAVVVSTRPYAANELMPLLMRNHFTSLERGRTDGFAFIQGMQPDLVLAVIDPSRFDDLDLLRSLADASDSVLVVLAPTSDALAASLRAGADVMLRDGDGVEAIDAQLVAIRRRLLLSRHPMGDDVIELGSLRIDRGAQRASAAGRPLALTNMEFSLLLALAKERGKVLSTLEVARQISGRVVAESEAAQSIKVYVRRLRQKLEQAGCTEPVIVNVRGRGYMLDSSIPTARAAGL